MSVSISQTDFQVPSGLPDIVTLGIQMWGQPTRRTPGKVEFGSRGSKHVEPAPVNRWFDHEGNRGGGYLDLYQLKHGKLPDLPGFPIPPGMAKELGNPLVWWDYQAADGQTIARVVRFHPPGRDKEYRQCRPDGSTWRWKMLGLKIPLYHLPELLQAPTGSTVCITEGEKCADQVRAWDMLATTNAGGAKKFRPDHAAVLARFDCVIIPDNDDAGRAHAIVVADALRAAGCASIRVVNLPDLPQKGDIINWVHAGGTAAAFAELVAAALAFRETTSRSAEKQTSVTVVAAAPTSDKPWTDYLQRTEEGEAINNLANAMTALRNAPELRQCFRFDEMLQVAVLVCPLPNRDPGILPRPVRDTDVSVAQEWLQRHDIRRLGKDIVHQAVALRAEENAFHPVRDYLNGLRWDRKPRLSTWLTFYAGCEPAENLSDDEKKLHREYLSAIGRMFLISMVARVMRPGCKVDYMLILESIQGEGKSTISEILAGQWFSDSLPNIGSDAVRISQHLRGKWLIEIGELSAMSKAETEDMKAFITRTEEQFTPKYARLEVTEPRQCVFVGTTNRSTYLRDETGGRRFWPAKAGTIDTIALAEDRDQLLAEAAVAYRSGEQWWPDRDFEKKYIQPQQDARREADAWEQTIGDWLDLPIQDDTQVSGISQRTACTVSEVAEYALRMETGRLGTADQRRIAAALECLGWERGERTKHARPWVRRPKPPPEE